MMLLLAFKCPNTHLTFVFVWILVSLGRDGEYMMGTHYTHTHTLSPACVTARSKCVRVCVCGGTGHSHSLECFAVCVQYLQLNGRC